jgi:hypothetical protein
MSAASQRLFIGLENPNENRSPLFELALLVAVSIAAPSLTVNANYGIVSAAFPPSDLPPKSAGG